ILPTLFGDTSKSLLLLAGLTVPFSLHTQLSAGLLALQGRVTAQVRAGSLAGGVQVVLLVGLLLFQHFGVGTVLGANLVAIVMTLALTLCGFRGLKPAWIRWDPSLLSESLRHSLI